MKKKVMFVGAGKYQVPGIIKAKEMGLEVVVIDGADDAQGFKFADKYYVLDIKDINSAIKIARENEIDGVLTIASDIGVRTVAAISELFGLPGIGTDVASRSTDKELMRKAFYANGVPSPKSRAVFSYEKLLDEAEKLGLPVVVKPSDNAGSRGVRLVSDKKEFKEAYIGAVGYSKQKKVLVEEFMPGTEISVEAFIDSGVVNFVAFSDKARTPPPFLLDTEVIFPSLYTGNMKSRIMDVAERAIKAVGIEIGPVHMELMITKDGPVPVELAARGPGFKVFTDIIPMVTGIDILKAQIDISLGRKPCLKHTRHLASVIKFFAAHDGILEEIKGIDEVKNMEGVYEVEFYVGAGDKVRNLTCGSDRIGHVISVSQTRDRAIDIIRRAEKILKFKVS